MQRRKFLATVGSLTAGTAAAMGTGAFTAMSADRTSNINVVNDSAGLLALVPDGEQVWEENGELLIDTSVGEDDTESYGVNRNSQYEFGDVTDSTWGGNEVSDYGYIPEEFHDDSLAEWYGTIMTDSGPVATDRAWHDSDGPAFPRDLDDRSNAIEDPFFAVQNNDTTAHDITLTFDGEIVGVLGQGVEGESPDLVLPDVGPGEVVNVALIIIAGDGTVDASGSITVSAD